VCRGSTSKTKELYPDGAHLPDRTPVQPTPTNFHSPNSLPTIGQIGYILQHFSIRRWPHATQQPSCTIFPSTWANHGSTLHTALHTMYTRFIRLYCSFQM